MAFSILFELDTTRDDWLVRVHTCRMWEFRNYKRKQELLSQDLILIDEKDNIMHPVIWKNQITSFREKLWEGLVIIIRNFKVSESTDVFGCLCGISDIESVGSKWKKHDIQIITKSDRSEKSKVTLWEEFGETFYPYLYPTESGPYIIIVTTTTLKEFRDTPYRKNEPLHCIGIELNVS